MLICDSYCYWSNQLWFFLQYILNLACIIYSLIQLDVFSFLVNNEYLQLRFFILFFLKQFAPHLLPSLLICSNFFFLKPFLDFFFINKVLQQIFGVDNGLSSIEIFYILQCLHQFHFSFRIIRFILKIFHRILLFLVYFKPFQIFFCLLRIFNCLIISRAPRLNDIIMIFGISFESYLSIAVSALKVKSENFNTQIGLFITYFHTHIKLRSDVQIVRTCVASQRHRQHVSHHHQFVFAPSSLHDSLMIEVLREILDQNFTLSHLISIQLYTLLKYNQNYLFQNIEVIAFRITLGLFQSIWVNSCI